MSAIQPTPKHDPLRPAWQPAVGPVVTDSTPVDREPVAKQLLFLGSVKWLETSQFDDHDLVALQRHRNRITPPPGVPRLGTGSMNEDHPVGDLDLEAMARPGGEWVTNGPLHGTGPDTFTPSIASVRGRPGVVHAVFLCLDTGATSIAADYRWFGEADVMFCAPGPDSQVAVYTFDVDNSAKTVMPQIQLPSGASWELFMWLTPSSH